MLSLRLPHRYRAADIPRFRDTTRRLFRRSSLPLSFNLPCEIDGAADNRNADPFYRPVLDRLLDRMLDSLASQLYSRRDINAAGNRPALDRLLHFMLCFSSPQFCRRWDSNSTRTFQTDGPAFL